MKKVLIISYYWPPSGGGGVQRWLKFVKYLPAFGWQPIIFTPENPDFPIQDPGLINDIPEEAEVLKFPIWEPYALFDKISGKGTQFRKQGIVENKSKASFLMRLSKWMRGNIFIPDPKVSWVGPSVSFLKNYIKERSIDAIVTTGPPHSMHLIGLKLKKKTGIKWIADFRDPWVRWDMMKNFSLSWPVRQAHKRLEKAVMRKADQVITVSATWASEMSSDHNINVKTITNGYDPDDFSEVTKQTPREFIISHSGLINTFRSPQVLWETLNEMCQDDPEFAGKLQIVFAGNVDPEIGKLIGTYSNLSSKCRFRGYISHDEVLEIYNSSSVLLLLLNNTENVQGHLPGKLFEYLAANRFILAIGDDTGEASRILTETKTGICCNPGDKASIKKTISDFFTHFKNGNFPDSDRIGNYSRKILTSRLVDVLEQL